MKKIRYHWFLLPILLIASTCESTNPDSLPYRPIVGPFPPGVSAPSTTSNTTRTLQTLPPAGAESSSHPLQIDGRRMRTYPGSDIVIEAVLDPGANYSRYYASYLSDGLKIYALMTVPNGPRPPTGWPAVIFNHGYIPPARFWSAVAGAWSLDR